MLLSRLAFAEHVAYKHAELVDIRLYSTVVPGILLKSAWDFVYRPRAKLTSKHAELLLAQQHNLTPLFKYNPKCLVCTWSRQERSCMALQTALQHNTAVWRMPKRVLWSFTKAEVCVHNLNYRACHLPACLMQSCIICTLSTCTYRGAVLSAAWFFSELYPTSPRWRSVGYVQLDMTFRIFIYLISYWVIYSTSYIADRAWFT